MSKKSSFTLIELIISSILTLLIVFFLYGAIAAFEETKEQFAKRYHQDDKFNQFYYLLYMDMFYSYPKTITISKRSTQGLITLDEKMADELSFVTKNSLYNFIEPTVTYTLLKDKKRLIRYETQKDINKSNENWFYEAEVLEFFENVDKFRVFKNQETYLFFVEIDKKPLSFAISLEFLKGTDDIKKVSDKNDTNKSTPSIPTDIKDIPPMPPGFVPPLPGRPQNSNSMPPMPPIPEASKVPLPGKPN